MPQRFRSRRRLSCWRSLDGHQLLGRSAPDENRLHAPTSLQRMTPMRRWWAGVGRSVPKHDFGIASRVQHASQTLAAFRPLGLGRLGGRRRAAVVLERNLDRGLEALLLCCSGPHLRRRYRLPSRALGRDRGRCVLSTYSGLARRLGIRCSEAAAIEARMTPASRSTEETMSQQIGARGNDRDQHQLLECLRCNFIAHMFSDVHAEHDWQHRSRRD
jgi:hypothetical protein